MGFRFGTERGRVVWTLSGIAALGAAGVTYLAVADPHDPSVPMPFCPTKLLTHLDCPACGGLRMVNSLIRGEWARAAQDNAYLLVALPLAALLLLRWALLTWRGGRWRMPAWVAYGFLVSAVVWMIVRNVPGWPWPPTTL